MFPPTQALLMHYLCVFLVELACLMAEHSMLGVGGTIFRNKLPIFGNQL